MEHTQAPGLKWIKRGDKRVPYWVASEKYRELGFEPKTVNLSLLADMPEMLVAKCNALHAEMELWATGFRVDRTTFDGTVRSLLTIYQSDAESGYQALKPSSLVPYKHYIEMLDLHIGALRIDDISGIDIKRWHRIWSDENAKLPKAAMMRSVLEAAVKHGILRRFKGCVELRDVIQAARSDLPQPRRREIVLTVADAVAMRKAAHASGRPSSALLYALVYETTLRLWDVAGQWWPIAREGVSDIINDAESTKWFGLRWDHIDSDLVMRYVPSKTAGTTGKSVTYPLSKAPMVMDELAHWPEDRRRGPVIISEATGLPYKSHAVTDRWHDDRKVAGINPKAWARDLRASGITEARAAGASTEDAAKVAGHSSTKTTSSVYDRAEKEAAERFADARVKGRGTKG